MRTRHGIFAGLASLAALVALAFGVPFALWHLAGWPLPHGIPSLHELREALSANDVPDTVIIKAIALVGWCAWLMLIVCLAVETIAWMRGRAARDVRGAATLQPLVRKLVATAALLVGSSLHMPTTASPHALATAVVATDAHRIDNHAAELSPFLPIAATQPLSSPTAVPAPAHPTYVVQRHDTLWALAETHLGDPFRWREIYDLSRATVQPDGRRLNDPNLIYPGWALTFPTDAAGLAPPIPPTLPSPEPVRASDPEPAPKSTTPAPTTANANESCAAPAPVAASKTANHDRQENSERTSPARGSDAREEDSTPAAVRLVGSTLLAASLVALLTRLRIVRRRNRAPGASAARRQSPNEREETLLRREASSASTDHLDIALRTLARSASTNRGAHLPQLLAVRLADGAVEVLLDAALGRSPRGFVDTGLGRTWKTQTTANWDALDRYARDTVHPAPALVHIGNRDADEYLIDLETAGVLSVTGDREASVAFIQHVLNQLTVPAVNQHVDVVAIGKELHSLAGSEYVRQYDTLGDAAADVEQLAQATARALDTTDCSTTFAARQADPTDAWAPTVLLCADDVEPEDIDLLSTLRCGRGIAAVVVAATPVSAWHVQLDGAAMLVEPLDLELEPVGLSAPTMTALTQLIEDSTARESAAEEDVVSATEAPARSPIARPIRPEEAEIEVRVLGPVDIVGIERIDRRRSVELITYLACHPEGVSDERLKTVLWPEEVPPHGTFHTQVSMARSKLGLDHSGELRLPHISTRGGRYRVSRAVVTDLDILKARVHQAKESNNLEAVALLRDALERVHGQPFTARAGYEWAHTEGIVSHAEVLVADAAHRLAQLCLELGDPDGAQWAAGQGLKAAPADEALYRDRMLAHDLAGNPTGVESVMRELCEVVEGLEPHDSLQPETVELHSRLAQRSGNTHPRAV